MKREPALILTAIVGVVSALAHQIVPDVEVDPQIINGLSLIVLGLLVRFGVVSPATHERATESARQDGRRAGRASAAAVLVAALSVGLVACQPPDDRQQVCAQGGGSWNYQTETCVAPPPRPAAEERSRRDDILDAVTDRAEDEIRNRFAAPERER